MTGPTGAGARHGPTHPVERTALAWQRTALSLMAASAALSRLVYGPLGAWALTSVAVGLPLGGWVLRESRRRQHDTPSVTAARRSRGGGAPLLLVVVIGALAVTALAAVLA